MGDIQLQIDLTNIVLALVAIVGLLAAWSQLRTTQLATRASVLLNLDERFGTPAMLEARNEMGALIARVDQRMEQEKGYLASSERQKTGSEYYAEELEKMRKEPPWCILREDYDLFYQNEVTRVGRKVGYRTLATYGILSEFFIHTAALPRLLT